MTDKVNNFPNTLKCTLVTRVIIAFLMFLMSMPIWNRFHGFGLIVSLVIVAVVCFKSYNAYKKVKLQQEGNDTIKVKEGQGDPLDNENIAVDLAQPPKAEAEDPS